MRCYEFLTSVSIADSWGGWREDAEATAADWKKCDLIAKILALVLSSLFHQRIIIEISGPQVNHVSFLSV